MSANAGTKVPPGYAPSKDLEIEPPGLRPATLVAAQGVLTVVLLGALSRELLVRAPRVYWLPTEQGTAVLWLSSALGAALGAVIGWRLPHARGAALSLSGASLAASGLGALWWWGFADFSRLPPVAALACLLSACFVAMPGLACVRWLRADAGALEAPLRLLAPARLGAAALVLGLVFAATANLPTHHASAALGVCLALLAFSVAPLQRFLWREHPSLPADRLAPSFALAVALASSIAAERRLPASEARIFPGTVALTVAGTRQRMDFVSVGSHFELYVDRALRLSALDRERFPEALVHPALLAAGRARKVLLLGAGTGLVEREILRSPGLATLVAVTTDRALVDLARRAPFPGEHARAALADPRVRVVEAEPVVFLQRSSERFDVIVVDVEDPIGYREGKHYTRHFYHATAAHLEPGGVMAIQLPSPLTFPQAFGSALATLESAGLAPLTYRAALPALGEWSFALASQGSPVDDLRARVLARRTELPRGLRYVTPSTLPSLLTRAPDGQGASAPPNTLSEQPIVELYAHENAQRP